MERSELLARLGFAPPEACRVRVIIDTDAKNEGDDDFAILHHLLTPQFDVRGICATHFEVKTTQRGLPPHSMERSYQADSTGCLRQIRGIPCRIGASGTALRRSGSLSISAADGRVPLRIQSPLSSAHRGQLDFGRQHYRRCPAGEWTPGALDTPPGPCAPAQPNLC